MEQQLTKATAFNYAFFVGREVQVQCPGGLVVGTVKQYFQGIIKLEEDSGREVYININNIVFIALNT
jgi:hypothetical protein